MSVLTVPQVGDRFDFRVASEHEPGRHTVRVIGVCQWGDRMFVTYVRERDDLVAARSLVEFHRAYPNPGRGDR
jgi:hypothetical protein